MKKLYWKLRIEAAYLLVWFLGRLPEQGGNWARSRFLGLVVGGLGKRCTIQANLRIGTPEKLFIGDDCNFGEDVFITAGGGVRIGNYVGIGAGAKIWSVNHKYEDPDVPWLEQGWEYKEVVVEDDAWIGANAFIMPGVTVGKGAIISAGTILSKSVPPYSIAAGNPGRVIGWRKKEDPKGDKAEGAAAARTAGSETGG